MVKCNAAATKYALPVIIEDVPGGKGSRSLAPKQETVVNTM